MVFFPNRRSASVPSTAIQALTPPSGLISDSIDRSNLAFARRQRASDQGGNSLASASPISFPGKKRIKDSVSRRDADFFKVEVSVPVNLRFKLRNQSSASLVGSVLDSQGQIASFQGTKLTAALPAGRLFDTSLSLPSGTYYVRLTTRSGEPARYDLRLNAVDPTAPPSAPDCGCGG